MPRDAAVVRARLQQAALELFTDNGYESTTALDIADRAGVTQRTFFRHFTDKREVFFDGESELRERLTEALQSLPPTVRPLPALKAAFHSVVGLIERNRPVTAPRASIIADTPALRERALAKEANLVELLTRLLQERGVEPRSAEICAEVGMRSFSAATRWWMDDGATDLHTVLDDSFDRLRLAARALR